MSQKMLEHDAPTPHATPTTRVNDNSLDFGVPPSSAANAGTWILLTMNPGFEADTRISEGNARSTVRPIKRSISDEGLTIQSKRGMLVATLSETGLRTQTEELPHPELHRAASDAQIEPLPSRHDSANTSAFPQHEPVTNIKHTDRPAAGSLQGEGAERSTRHGDDSDVENTAPGFQPHAIIRSNSNPDLRTTSGNAIKRHVDIPLKACLRKKAESTTTSPPAELFDATDDGSDTRTLRRVKTVEFERFPRPCVFLTAPTETYEKPARIVPGRVPAKTLRSKRSSYKRLSCLNIIQTAKSSLAHPATTRTDVHVIAIAPSRNVDHVANEGVDPPTPTMQTIETDTDCYEVIWDDVPSEHNIRTERRSSSASYSLMAVSSTSTRGLQRVNSKLTDWSGTWNTQSESFKPTVIVFPDSGGRRPHFESIVEDDNALVVAPPNSQRTSATPSRLPSRSVSTPTTRSASRESIKFEDAVQEDQGASWIIPTLIVPYSDVQSSRRISGSRKLSSIQDDELKFRGHRDSLTLAHSRLVSAGGVSPELFAHRDSVAIARKRMHARNRAMSSARQMGMLGEEALDEDGRVADLRTGKRNTVQVMRDETAAIGLGT
jgi:hypothetical protein